MVEKDVELKVAEAIQDDVNKGIVKIDSNFMKDININAGDIVEIQGERKTVAIAERSYPGDLGLNIVRMDGITRRNAKTGIGELIKIRKSEVKEAKKVTIAPATKEVMINISPNILKRGLLGRAVIQGDIVSLGGTSRRRIAMTANPIFEDIFKILDETSNMNFGFGDIKFVVAKTDPKTPVIISENTQLVFNPEATEVLEDRALDVTYEDIGGLDEEIRKVRELIELPIKHPEVFERLGMEPPKGILLHGPPGTGKTLLAKAVANESNANFILINGPEIMCVDGNTKILTNPKGDLTAKKIFEDAKKDGEVEGDKIEVVKLKKPVSTFAINKKGKMTKAKITHTTKLKAPSYKVKLTDGNNLVVSHNQPFLVCREGELVWKRLEELKPGEFVAKANKIGIKGKSHQIRLSIKNLIEKNKLYTIKSKNLSRSNWVKLPRKTSPKLMELMGLVMSDGHVDKRKESITFSNNERLLRERFKELTKRLFQIKNVKEYKDGRVVIYSKTIAEYLNLLGIDSGKKESRVTPYMYSLPKKEIEAFIRGYFDGDGCVAITPIKTKKRDQFSYPTPKIFCKSKIFLEQLQSLMQLRLGISTKVNKHKTPKGLMHELIVRGYEGRKKFLAIGSSGNKLRKLKKINLNKRVKEFENVPTPKFLIKAIREKILYKKFRNNDYYIYGKGKFTKYSLNKLFNLADKYGVVNKQIIKEFNLLNRRDLAWEQIKGIAYVGEKELYDFTVDKDSFVTSNLLLLHNSKFYGQSEENLRKKFDDAEKNSPSIIFIDEIDAIAPKREESKGEVERRVVAQLLTTMDGLKSRGKVVVIAATNRPNDIDPALRRPGRFDREIVIGVPAKDARLEMLKIHTRNMPLAKNISLKNIAEVTHGFVGADIAALAKEAAMTLLRRILPELKMQDETIPKELLEKLTLTQKDFNEALRVVRPSALREVLVEIPNVKWNDIGGLEEVKQELIEAVEWPLKRPDDFTRLGIKPPKGVLLYGAPGTGKTMLAKAIANESKANFILVKGPELISKWVGESEKGVRRVFEKARQTAPCIIFFDEIDALASRRTSEDGNRVNERVVNQMLSEMDGLEELQDIVVIAATNRPDMLDTALLRPGRFDRIILSPIPDSKTREQIFKVHTNEMPLKGVNIKYLVSKTEGYVGADIEAVCREAAIFALRKNKDTKGITKQNFEEAMNKVRASVDKEIEEAYAKLKDQFRSARAKQLKEEKPSYYG